MIRKTPPVPLLAVSLALALAAGAAGASSTASSASVEGSSASVGSVSGSIQASSDSSSRTVVAAGTWRVIEIAAAPGPDERLRVTLRALEGGQEFALRLPPATAQQARLAVGDLVQVRERSYGWQFARADAPQPFFLVVGDAVFRDLQSHPVALSVAL